jgi:molybdopterin-guanine dinucleotide biosynthesis protein A
MATIATRDITGVILAGGRGRRVGGADKGLLPLRGRPLIEHVLAALRPQVGELLISANRNLDRYAAYGDRVLADDFPGYPGPLAGMWCALRATHTPYVLSVPCDVPAPPADLAARLGEALVRERSRAAVAVCRGRRQPVFALLHRDLADDLQTYLDGGGREVGAWLTRQSVAPADFSDHAHAFENVNTPDDLRRAEAAQS